MSQATNLRRTLAIWTAVGIASVLLGAYLYTVDADAAFKAIAAVLIVVGVGLAGFTASMRLRLDRAAGEVDL